MIALIIAVVVLVIYDVFLHYKLWRMHRDFAILEQVCAPIVEWIQGVTEANQKYLDEQQK